MNIYWNEPITGVARAADIDLVANARCTSTKFVVQYPKDSTKPSPKTMPTTERNEESKPVSACPVQEFSCWSAGATVSGLAFAAAVILSVSPLHQPTLCRPIRVSGSSDATITKNCSTSL